MNSLFAKSEVGGLSWADHGLPGLVIGALFLALFYLIKVNKEEREETRKMQVEERKEWNASRTANNDSMKAVVKELTTAINNLK